LAEPVLTARRRPAGAILAYEISGRGLCARKENPAGLATGLRCGPDPRFID
jgi:hypothetical protein